MMFADDNHISYNGIAMDAMSTGNTMTPDLVTHDGQVYYMFGGGLDIDKKNNSTTQRVMLLNKYGVKFFAKIEWESRLLMHRMVAPKNKTIWLGDNEGETASVKVQLIATAMEHHGWDVLQLHHEINKYAPKFANRCYPIKQLVNELKDLTEDQVHYAFD